ncbi:MAG: PDZ domain-containing protein [Bryobacterales bacterium]|nr:PDZ domain-containing protein [Bryobacterales bacterium]
MVLARDSVRVLCASAAFLALGLPAMAQQDSARPVAVVVPGSAPRSFLGVAVVEINADRAKALKLTEEQGVEVTRVEEDSPASRAGLKIQDAVLEYHGQRIEGVEQFVRLVRETPSGRQVKLLVGRNGQTVLLTATIASRRMKTLEVGDMRIAVPPTPELPRDPAGEGVPLFFLALESPVLGIEAESLNSQLAEFLGVKEGVLVRLVRRQSVAERAGLRAGDVIVKVGDRKVVTPLEVVDALRAGASAKNVPLTIVREKKNLSLAVSIEDGDGRLVPRGRAVRFPH